MTLSRRQFVAAGLGAALVGCTHHQSSFTRRPGPDWPAMPVAQLPGRAVNPANTAGSATRTTSSVRTLGSVRAIPRSQWARGSAKMSQINPMQGVNQITLHHEGSSPVWFVDSGSTARRLESIRNSHRGRGWADIGYHYIIDRSGKVWQGRDIRYQGAHVRNHNEHNLGVMVLGNFEQQQPSSAQLSSLRTTLATLARQYRVPANRIHTHRELTATSCPGRYLQPQIAWIRKSQLG